MKGSYSTVWYTNLLESSSRLVPMPCYREREFVAYKKIENTAC